MRFSFLLLVFCLFIPSITQAARRTRNVKHNSIYLQGMAGKSFLTESDNDLTTFKTDQETISSTAFAAILGYRFRYFCLELGYADLGETGYKFGNLYEEKHDASMITAGVKWMWGWFELKLGGGSVKDTVNFTKGSGATTLVADPNKEENNAVGGYFGIGLNIDLWGTTELIFDYTGYSWTIDEEQKMTLDGGESSTSDLTHGMAVLSVGLRTFF
jgi:hypothetical protein